ncbi:hypothetical protein LIS82_07815 [Cytobacillus solani]|uniref:hypothetical protein n=1 Tax=Cytobacillus solani TaxID=1637975 RepID=UPI002079D88D|nr:hypothetical protein [Cytobacillus solani]USK56367.1 hypothetical protein LIS82_07815 [Cytobacillus solani]
MAYLTQVRAGGKQYIYLTEYCGNQQYSTKSERNIFSFGSTSIAILRMRKWLWNFDKEFPSALKELGFTKQHLAAWLKQLETGKTPNGKSFRVEREPVEFYNIYNIY